MASTTKILRLGSVVTSAASSLAAESLATGAVIAVPTDTIYGLACLVQHSAAVERLYTIKVLCLLNCDKEMCPLNHHVSTFFQGRNAKKPIAICVAEVEDIYSWANVTVSRQVIEALLPGQVTLVFTRSEQLNNKLNPDTDLVGVRIPDHSFLRHVCRLCGGPLALTSANLSNDQSTLAVEEFSDLHTSLELVCDGGRLSDSEEARLGSTVVDLSQEGSFTIIRAGSVRENVETVMKKNGICQR